MLCLLKSRSLHHQHERTVEAAPEGAISNIAQNRVVYGYIQPKNEDGSDVVEHNAIGNTADSKGKSFTLSLCFLSQ